jgi:outer membrane lipoprotein-sorting protein
MKKYLTAFLLIAAVAVSAQTKDPKKLLDAVRQKFNKVNDYKADALVRLDMSFIKVPEMNAKIFFKKPDKMKVDAEGFAMIPRQGLKFSPADLLKEDFTALYVRSETIDNRKIDVVKAIPNSDSSEVILSTFWLDAAESVIRKVESTSKKGGTTQIELSYDNYEFGLPSQIKLSFNLGNIQMPGNVPNQSNENEAADPDKKHKRRRGLPEGSSLKGSVIMTYKNYQINKGIPDSFFVEKAKEEKAKIN